MFSSFFSIFPKKSFKRSASSRAYHILYMGPPACGFFSGGGALRATTRRRFGKNAAALWKESRGVFSKARGEKKKARGVSSETPRDFASNAAAFRLKRRGVVGRAVGGGRKVPRIPYFFSFSRSRISPSSFSSFEGSGSGAGAAGTSAFLRLKRLMSFTIRNTHQATMRKSMQVWMKAP